MRGRGCVFQFPLQADQGDQHVYNLGTALVDVHPPRKLVQIHADAGKLADVFLFQRRLPKAIIQGALPDEIRHGLALAGGLGVDGLFLSRGDAQLDPGRAGVLLRLHGVTGLCAFSKRGFLFADKKGKRRVRECVLSHMTETRRVA